MAPDESYMSSEVLEFEASVNSTFEPGSCYGKVVLGHFCSGCILENVNVDKLPMQYCVTRIFPNNSHSCAHEMWKADFVFSYALPTCLKVWMYYNTSECLIYSNYVIGNWKAVPYWWIFLGNLSWCHFYAVISNSWLQWWASGRLVYWARHA